MRRQRRCPVPGEALHLHFFRCGDQKKALQSGTAKHSFYMILRKDGKAEDFHCKTGDLEILRFLSKIGRSPAKSGDLEPLLFG